MGSKQDSSIGCYKLPISSTITEASPSKYAGIPACQILVELVFVLRISSQQRQAQHAVALASWAKGQSDGLKGGRFDSDLRNCRPTMYLDETKTKRFSHGHSQVRCPVNSCTFLFVSEIDMQGDGKVQCRVLLYGS